MTALVSAVTRRARSWLPGAPSPCATEIETLRLPSVWASVLTATFGRGMQGGGSVGKGVKVAVGVAVTGSDVGVFVGVGAGVSVGTGVSVGPVVSVSFGVLVGLAVSVGSGVSVGGM